MSGEVQDIQQKNLVAKKVEEFDFLKGSYQDLFLVFGMMSLVGMCVSVYLSYIDKLNFEGILNKVPIMPEDQFSMTDLSSRQSNSK